MDVKDYYQLLGVSRYASDEVLRCAFRKRIRAVHPDHNPRDAAAAERTRKLIEAYDVLRDPVARTNYDRSLALRQHADCPITHYAAPNYRHERTRPLMPLIIFITLLAVAVGLLTAHAQRPPVYRAHLIEQWTPEPPITIVELTEPNVSDFAHWYVARQYNSSIAGDWAIPAAMEFCSEAALKASRHGNEAAERFYRTWVAELRDGRLAPVR